MKHLLTFLLSGVVFLAAFFLIVYSDNPQNASASVVQGNEYTPTSTYAAVTPVRTLKTGSGSLAQVTITGANTGLMTLYDATTSNVTLRTGQTATSALSVLADFPASTATGTYTFDAVFNQGLLQSGSGAVPTTTITYR